MRETLFHAEAKDFRVDTYRGSGPGGQHRNKTDSCVRITHKESGLFSSACESRSQGQNKKAAFRKLAEMLIEHYVPTQQKERMASGVVIVRNYHAVENRVKDAESGLQQSFEEVLSDPSQMITARAEAL
jgi:protein subunit release factor B